MHTARYYLPIVLLATLQHIHGMQQAQTVETNNINAAVPVAQQEYKILTGSLQIYGKFRYAGYEQHPSIFNDIKRICDENGTTIELKPSDLLSACTILSDASEELCAYIFPKFMPVSFLRDKKEGEEITFFLKVKSNLIFKIVLTCKHYEFSRFEYDVAGRAAQQPSYWLGDEKQLRKDGLLPEEGKEQTALQPSSNLPSEVNQMIGIVQNLEKQQESTGCIIS